MSQDQDYRDLEEIRGLIGSCNLPKGFYQETIGFKVECSVDNPGGKLPLSYKVAGGKVESDHYDRSQEKERSEVLAEANGAERTENFQEEKAQTRAEVLFEADDAESLKEVFDSFLEKAEPYNFELVENGFE